MTLAELRKLFTGMDAQSEVVAYTDSGSYEIVCAIEAKVNNPDGSVKERTIILKTEKVVTDDEDE